MIIYEKDNKLNINFENNVEEQADLQISKSGDKTEVLIDGQPGGSGSGGSAPLVVTFSGTTDEGDASCDKTFEEIKAAYIAGKEILFRYIDYGRDDEKQFISLYSVFVDIANNTPIRFFANSTDIALFQSISSGHALSFHSINCHINEEGLDITIDNEEVNIS